MATSIHEAHSLCDGDPMITYILRIGGAIVSSGVVEHRITQQCQTGKQQGILKPSTKTSFKREI